MLIFINKILPNIFVYILEFGELTPQRLEEFEAEKRAPAVESNSMKEKRITVA